MARRDKRHLLLYTGAFVAPLAVIRLMGGVTSASEASTPAAAVDANTYAVGTVQFSATAVTGAQRAANDRIRELGNESFGAFPFVFKAPEQRVVAPVAPRALAVEINAIMNSSSGPTALIDGTLVRVGDAVSDGQWIVESIDPDGRTIVFREQESGRLVTKIVAPIF